MMVILKYTYTYTFYHLRIAFLQVPLYGVATAIALLSVVLLWRQVVCLCVSKGDLLVPQALMEIFPGCMTKINNAKFILYLMCENIFYVCKE